MFLDAQCTASGRAQITSVRARQWSYLRPLFLSLPLSFSVTMLLLLRNHPQADSPGFSSSSGSHVAWGSDHQPPCLAPLGAARPPRAVLLATLPLSHKSSHTLRVAKMQWHRPSVRLRTTHYETRNAMHAFPLLQLAETRASQGRLRRSPDKILSPNQCLTCQSPKGPC